MKWNDVDIDGNVSVKSFPHFKPSHGSRSYGPAILQIPYVAEYFANNIYLKFIKVTNFQGFN